MTTYQEILEARIHDAMEERHNIDTSITRSNNEFAEYLKQNFNGQIAEIQENIKKEENKSKFRKFLDKLIKVL